jgi:hypothetical protein
MPGAQVGRELRVAEDAEVIVEDTAVPVESVVVIPPGSERDIDRELEGGALVVSESEEIGGGETSGLEDAELGVPSVVELEYCELSDASSERPLLTGLGGWSEEVVVHGIRDDDKDDSGRNVVDMSEASVTLERNSDVDGSEPSPPESEDCGCDVVEAKVDLSDKLRSLEVELEEMLSSWLCVDEGDVVVDPSASKIWDELLSLAILDEASEESDCAIELL